VNQFGWGPAIGSLLLPVLAIACCLAVAVGVVLSAVSPELRDIFLTPVP